MDACFAGSVSRTHFRQWSRLFRVTPRACNLLFFYKTQSFCYFPGLRGPRVPCPLLYAEGTIFLGLETLGPCEMRSFGAQVHSGALLSKRFLAHACPLRPISCPRLPTVTEFSAHSCPQLRDTLPTPAQVLPTLAHTCPLWTKTGLYACPSLPTFAHTCPLWKNSRLYA